MQYPIAQSNGQYARLVQSQYLVCIPMGRRFQDPDTLKLCHTWTVSLPMTVSSQSCFPCNEFHLSIRLSNSNPCTHKPSLYAITTELQRKQYVKDLVLWRVTFVVQAMFSETIRFYVGTSPSSHMCRQVLLTPAEQFSVLAFSFFTVSSFLSERPPPVVKINEQIFKISKFW